MKIGVIACDVLQRELEKVLDGVPEVTRKIYLEYALHTEPQRMKETIKEQINAMRDEVDVIFLGYGYCKSLQGIENEFDIPIVMARLDDCISLLLTPEGRAREIDKEAGTYFLSPGWAELGTEMLIKELHLERVRRYGKDPLEIAKKLFTNYKRGLYIDTGIGDNDYFLSRSEQFCRDFNLTLERTAGTSSLLEEMLSECKRIAAPGCDQK
ncbi:MAG: DUF1638 domain-containing protein [Alphaproteobacteria bacterium]|uniref:DUF1638 domain-containing protein n=1 Tax=Candidatus Nitrobium versatile TaxID=2884831 RepID=A0A953LVR7_9BACT|nr:DUF1638 domain-containing protein [Candidatus Nitrobium versatile]